jgi:hypothetical protein
MVMPMPTAARTAPLVKRSGAVMVERAIAPFSEVNQFFVDCLFL